MTSKYIAATKDDHTDVIVLTIFASGWVHIYPEGKVNTDPTTMLRFKWGLGRLIMEADVPPFVVPMYHAGQSVSQSFSGRRAG